MQDLVENSDDYVVFLVCVLENFLDGGKHSRSIRNPVAVALAAWSMLEQILSRRESMVGKGFHSSLFECSHHAN
jgi:hypothetical protein